MPTLKNLSERLFKPQNNCPETSSLVRQGQCQFSSLLEGDEHSNWYRTMNKLAWHWNGIPYVEIEQVIARIAASTKKRANENWLDTVIGYQPGNWIYEFLTESVQWSTKAEQLLKQQDDSLDEQILANSWAKAALLASIGSYPYYRNDNLSYQAQVFAMRAYREVINHSPYLIKELDFKVENKTVKAILHTPMLKNETPKSFPLVFWCGGLNSLQTDFYHYFSEHFAPHGIGVLTVDLPGIGYSKQFTLSQNTSMIHQSILQQIQTVPLIDYTKIVLLGYRFGANIAMRLAYLAPQQVRGVINIAPILHHLFVDGNLQARLPLMYRDLIIDRLGLANISQEQLLAELKFFSLKEQRLLLKPCAVPLLNAYFDNDIMNTESDVKLLTSTKKVTSVHIKKTEISAGLNAFTAQSIEWIKKITA